MEEGWLNYITLHIQDSLDLHESNIDQYPCLMTLK